MPAPQHQFGLQRIAGGALLVDQAEGHPSGASQQRSPPGEQCCPDHPGCSPDDADAAMVALVAVAPARRTQPDEVASIQRVPGGRHQRFGIDIQAGEGQFAAAVRPVCGQQPGLECKEGESARRLDGGAVRLPGIGVKPAGQVEREHLGTGPRVRGDRGDVRREHASGRALQADPEQPVDDQRPVAARGGRAERAAPGRAPGGQGPGSIRRKSMFIAVEHHVDRMEGFAQPARCDQCVAAVVARPGKDQHTATGVAEHLDRQGGGRTAGPLHQRQAVFVRDRSGGQPFDRSQVGGRVQRGRVRGRVRGWVRSHGRGWGRHRRSGSVGRL